MAAYYEKYDLNQLRKDERTILYQDDTVNLHGIAAGVGANSTPGGCHLELALPCRSVYGMGERFTRVNQKGLSVHVEVLEKFCNQGEISYCPIPFFFTDSGYGIWIDGLTVSDFLFQDPIEIKVQADSMGKLPDVYLFKGEPAQILSCYSELTGRPVPVPRWSLGPWMSANRWHTEAEVFEQVALMERYDIPNSVMVLEAWSDEATFYRFSEGGEWQEPMSLSARLLEKGISLVLWQIPVFKRLSDAAYHPVLAADWGYAVEHDLCIKKADGSPYLIPEDHWFSGSMLPDFTNPDTKKWWFEKRQYLLDAGVRGFKTDGGEFILSDDAVSFDGKTGLELRNAYALQYTKAYSEFIGKDRVLFSRAGYTGQQTRPIQWAGDQVSTWDELRHVLSAGLSIGLSGVPFWSFDIGGFAGPMPTPELYLRSLALSVFAPVMQWHSEPVGGQFAEQFPQSRGINDRSPWNMAAVYGEEDFIDRVRFWFRLRMNLLPYLEQQAKVSCSTGLPMMRHLILEYPEDESAAAVEDCFMLGDILIAPVIWPDTEVREVYLPEGMWTELFGLEVEDEKGVCLSCTEHAGGQRLRVRCGRDRIPVFVRAGGCIALNLDDSLTLGSDVGNDTTSYRKLCFYPVGAMGESYFADDFGNEIRIRWESSNGERNVTVDHLSGRQSYTILNRL